MEKRISFGILLLVFIVGIRPGKAESVHKVDTTPAAAHILLEEFTGLHCSYCPQAHTIANNLTYVNPGRVHVMAVHTGSLAVPSGNDPDLRTPYGDSLYLWAGQGGMPSGDINRTVYPECTREDSYTLSRGDWMHVARRLLNAETPAPVNLYAEARIEPASPDPHIYIDVEAYGVNPTPAPVFLHVALTENFVPGSQAGSGISSYLHRHVLRDLVTGLYGDTLKPSEFTKGSYLSRTYDYALPAQFGNRVPNQANLACLVFITDSTGAVLNSMEAEVACAAKAPLDYLQITLNRLGKYYGGSAYDVYVVNPSDDTVRSLTFAFELNGEKREYALQGLNVWPKTETVVTLQTDFAPDALKKVNIYSLRLTQANGKSIQSNLIQSSFNEPLDLSSEAVKIEFTGDAFGSDNEIRLTDVAGRLVYGAGPFADGVEAFSISDELPVEPGQIYVLDVTDSFRDGVEDGGGIRILDARDSVWYRSYIGSYGHLISFRRPGAETAVEAVEAAGGTIDIQLYPNPTQADVEVRLQGWAAGRAEISVYNLQGQPVFMREILLPAGGKATEIIEVSDFPQGIYMVRVLQNRRHVVKKLVVRH